MLKHYNLLTYIAFSLASQWIHSLFIFSVSKVTEVFSNEGKNRAAIFVTNLEKCLDRNGYLILAANTISWIHFHRSVVFHNHVILYKVFFFNLFIEAEEKKRFLKKQNLSKHIGLVNYKGIIKWISLRMMQSWH